MMRRRQLITVLGGAAAAPSLWPLAARAQRVPNVGMLITNTESDEQGQLRVAAFRQSLARLGWTDGRNVRIEIRWGNIDAERMRALGVELVALRPDVLFASDTAALTALRQATRSIPIVFTQVSDPVGGGFVASLARPGGNITGFMPAEPPLAGKWLELLKGMAPRLKRAALLFDPEVDTYAGEFFRHADAVAKALTIELTAVPVREEAEIEAAILALAREGDGGLIVMPDSFTVAHRTRIIAGAAAGGVPAIYAYRFLAAEGGLIAYGIDAVVLYQQAATYIDRVLRGAKPGDLPVQAPTKFELVINLKTAKAMGLNISQDMLSIADEVIE
jgi:putative ABC transport system substrate-binding protein